MGRNVLRLDRSELQARGKVDVPVLSDRFLRAHSGEMMDVSSRYSELSAQLVSCCIQLAIRNDRRAA